MNKAPNKGEQALMEAAALITGPRQTTYGSPDESFGKIAKLWEMYKGTEFTPYDVTYMLFLLKVSRLMNGYHEDSNRDGMGYLALGAEMAE
jgi:hypothetical protein